MRLVFISFFINSFVFGQPKQEFLSFKTSRINRTTPGALTKIQLLQRLGKPTKIQPFETVCGMTEEQEKAKVRNWYYYDSTKFFVYDSKAEVVEINFRNGKFSYTTQKITLSNNTSFQELQKVYPLSAKAALKESNGNIVRIRPCAVCDGYCILYFEKGKLVKLEWWEDC